MESSLGESDRCSLGERGESLLGRSRWNCDCAWLRIMLELTGNDVLTMDGIDGEGLGRFRWNCDCVRLRIMDYWN